MNSSSNIHGSCQSTSSSAASSDCGYSCSSCSLSVESVEQQQVEAKTELLITSLDLPGTMSSSSTSASALSSHQEDLLVLDSRDFYARRIQSLERFRHRCAQKIQESSAAEGRQQIAKEQEQHPESPSDVFARLQSDMVSAVSLSLCVTGTDLLTEDRSIENFRSWRTPSDSHFLTVIIIVWPIVCIEFSMNSFSSWPADVCPFLQRLAPEQTLALGMHNLVVSLSLY